MYDVATQREIVQIWCGVSHVGLTIDMTNVSERTGTLEGVPTVQIASVTGKDIPTHENLEASNFPYLSYPVHRVVLTPLEAP